MSRCFKRFLIAGLVLSLSPVAFAKGPVIETGRSKLEITIRLYDYAKVPGGTLRRAQAIVTQVFRRAGVGSVWVACPTSYQEYEQYPDCRGPLGPRDLVVRILPVTQAAFAGHRGVLGAALLCGDGEFAITASVFFDRVQRLTWEKLYGATEGIFAHHLSLDICNSVILGVVMAHEIGHLLLGTNSHSRRGIMRPNWSRQDLEEALSGRQRFTLQQVRRLQAGIRARLGTERATLQARAGDLVPLPGNRGSASVRRDAFR